MCLLKVGPQGRFNFHVLENGWALITLGFLAFFIKFEIFPNFGPQVLRADATSLYQFHPLDPW